MATSQSTIKSQQATLAQADRHRYGWSSADLELVTEFEDESDAALALALGRSLYAVKAIKALLRDGRPAGSSRIAASDRPYRGWMEGEPA